MEKNDKYWESSHSSNSKKNLKRKVVSRIKKMNKNLRDDPLWKGRFVIHCDDIFMTVMKMAAVIMLSYI